MTEEQRGRLLLEASTGAHGEAAKQLSLMAIDYRTRLAEINNWIVCAAIATPEDMMQSAPEIERISRVRGA